MGARERACSVRSSASSSLSTRPISRIASRPSRGRLPWAARPSVSISTHSKPLWAMAIASSVGSVTTAPSARHRVTSASAPMLACSSSTTHAMISWPASSPPPVGDHARGVHHRRDAALHVLRAAAVDAAVTLDRDRTAATCRPRRPYRCARRASVSARIAAVKDADHVGTSRRDFLHVHRQPEGAHVLGERAADRGFAARAGHERRVDRVDAQSGS